MAEKRIVDFDAWRAEQKIKSGEAEKPEAFFVIGGKSYEMPSQPPATIVLDVIRLKKLEGEDAEVPLTALKNIGEAIFGEESFREILELNKIEANELGDMIIQAFRAWPEHMTESDDVVPNRKTRRAGNTSI